MAGPSLDPADHNWDRQLETRLPDCRLKPIDREAARFRQGRLVLDQVFCSSCHKPYGGVPPTVPHVFYICDDCAHTKGAPPECTEVKLGRG